MAVANVLPIPQVQVKAEAPKGSAKGNMTGGNVEFGLLVGTMMGEMTKGQALSDGATAEMTDDAQAQQQAGADNAAETLLDNLAEAGLVSVVPGIEYPNVSPTQTDEETQPGYTQTGKEANSGLNSMLWTLVAEAGSAPVKMSLTGAERPYHSVWQMGSTPTGNVGSGTMETMVLGMKELDNHNNSLSSLLQQLQGQVQNQDKEQSPQPPNVLLTKNVMQSIGMQANVSGQQDVNSQSTLETMNPKGTFEDAVQNGFSLASGKGDGVTANVAPVSSSAVSGNSLFSQISQILAQFTPQVRPQELRELTLRLHPAELGKLDVALRMQDGQLHLAIKASEASTGSFLQNHMQDLRQSLTEAGILCASLEMSFGDGGGSGSFEEALAEHGRRSWDQQENSDNPGAWNLNIEEIVSAEQVNVSV